MASQVDYLSDEVNAARSVLVEIIHVLHEYEEGIVLVGGWVPDLLFPNANPKHIGSTDVDLALNHWKIKEEGYKKIHELLSEHGYTANAEQPFIYYKVVKVQGRDITVQVDFLAGEYGGTGEGRRTQTIQEVRARKARGCDIAFDMTQEVTIKGELPGGGKDEVKVRLASIVPFIVMKGMALDGRMKEKDAWDIHFCLRNSDLNKLIEEFKPHLGNPLVKEGLEKIARKFASPKHVGPKFVADFEQSSGDDREILQRDAYERVSHLLRGLGISAH